MTKWHVAILSFLIASFVFAPQSDAQSFGYSPFGDQHWKYPVASVAALPAVGNVEGDARVELTDFEIYIWNGSAWVEASGGGGGGSVTAVTASSPLFSSGGTTPNITCQTASGSLAGCLSSADWNTFNNKQAAGSYITALTGDGSASGPGSAAFTLATVNSNVGSFGLASSVGSFVVNAKGLITSAVNTAIQIAESQVTNLVSDLAGKQPVGNYITSLTGPVTASGPGAAATTITPLSITNSMIANGTINLTTKVTGLLPAANLASIQYSQEAWVQVNTGDDSLGDGSFQRPWKTLLHACGAISTSTLIHMTGSAGDTSASPITCPYNTGIVSQLANFTIPQPITVSSGGTNTFFTMNNLVIDSTFTWTNSSTGGMLLVTYNTAVTGLTTFKNTGAGVADSNYFAFGGTLEGLDNLSSEVNLQNVYLAGPMTYEDSGTAYLVMSACDIAGAITLNGSVASWFTGSLADAGYSIAGVTTGSGTPSIIGDSGSLPPPGSITGAYTISFTSYANYVNYAPATPGNWSPTPSLVNTALDQLAARPAALTTIAPTVQIFTTGSGTYTLPTSPRTPLYLDVQEVGAGGGGSGSGTSGATNGANGGTTSFGTSFLISLGGNGGVAGGSSATPGGAASSVGAGATVIHNVSGSAGDASAFTGASAPQFPGGRGGVGPFGGGAGGSIGGGIEDGPDANSGSGGTGGSINAASANQGSGGGAGNFLEVIIPSPSSSYSYSIGAAGGPGAAGSFGQNGTSGGNGIIIVTEHYQ